LAKLEANVSMNPDGFKPERLVETHAARTGQDDLRKGGAKSLPSQHPKQRLVEPQSDSRSAVRLVNVDRRVNGSAIGWTVSVPAGIGIAHDVSLAIFRDQPGMRCNGAGDPPCHDIGRRGFDLEGNSSILDLWMVDRGDSGCIVLCCRSNAQL
jgi:hypothetical protein